MITLDTPARDAGSTSILADDVRSFRVAALANGYTPIPVRTGGKEPTERGWTNGVSRDVLLSVRTDASNTGIVCDGLRVIDVDVDDRDDVAIVVRLMKEHLPSAAIVRRRRNSGRFAAFYRAANGAPGKLKVGHPGRAIEVLGRGQQVVVDGIHPTGARFEWLKGRSPANVPVSSLTSITEEQLARFSEACAQALGVSSTFASNVVDFPGPSRTTDHRAAAANADLGTGLDDDGWFDRLVTQRKGQCVEFCLGHLDNTKHDPRGLWLSVLFAVADAGHRGCPNPRELALAWSQRGAGWTGEADFDRAWSSYKPGRTTVGTLIYLAERAGADLSQFRTTASPTSVSTSFVDPWQDFAAPLFPTSILSPVLKKFVELQHKALGADPSAIAMACITVVAGAMHAQTKVQAGSGWEERPILWCALVGAPSAMKSPVLQKVTSPLNAIDKLRDLQWRTQHSSWQRLKGAGGNSGPPPSKLARSIIQDATAEKVAEILARDPRGSLMVHDELAGWLGGFERYRSGAPSRAFYLSSWNGGYFLKDRVGKGAKDFDAEIRVDNLALSVLGGIQPERLVQMHDLTGDGLLQRFLPVLMRRSERGGDTIDLRGSEAQYQRFIETVSERQPLTYWFADEAVAVRERVRDRLFTLEQLDAFPAPVVGAIGKLKGYFARLALVLQVASECDAQMTMGGPPPRQPIPRSVAEAAEQLVMDFVLPHIIGLYDLLGGGEDTETIRAIAGFILASDKDRLRPSDLTEGVRKLRGLPQQKIAEWAGRFYALGWLAPENENAPVVKAWIVVPGLREHFAQRRLDAQRARAEAHRILRQARKPVS